MSTQDRGRSKATGAETEIEGVWAAKDTASAAATTGGTGRENEMERSGVFGGGYSSAQMLTLRCGDDRQTR